MKGDIPSVKDAGGDSCCTFTVRVELTGFKGRDCELTATLVDADGAETPGETTMLTVEADTDRGSADVLVPATETGTYSVRFVLRNPDGGELDRSETQPFDVP